MPTLTERDAAVIAGIEKLRFFPLEVVSGHGSRLIDTAGRRLLDLTATWTACGLGHGHPAVAEAIARAAQHPAGAGGLSAVHPDSVGLAEDLLALVPGAGERRVYLGHAGSDACDVVLRACRHATGRRRIVAFEHSYHGGLGVAMGVSGVHVDAGATPDADAVFVPYPDPYRPHTGDADTVVKASVLAVEQELERGDVACVIVEAIQSDGGLVVPPDGFLAALHDVCRRYGVLLVCDEVKVGLGRPGLLHAFAHDGVTPDLVAFGKTIGGALPLSAAVGPAEVLDGPPASALLTTAGNPICTAAGRAVLRTLVSERIPEAAAARGAQLMALLREFAASDAPGAEFIGDVRGRGLAIGVDLVTDRTAKTRADDLARKTVYRAWQLGAVVYYVGGNVLEVTPPMVITEDEVAEAAQILTAAIADAAAGVVTDEMVAPYAGW
ncbi:MAG TPA: aminotransferase class III-fold pyridoxal phosphate-dependent enzyme [Jatrophihabitans sp.]|nr:aminotransferase class III-fold pyridoxal phosphate-dependent enzyme [Jatrophihabitans sp.]